MTLAEWYRRNKLLLQHAPDNLERSRTVAVALVPLFKAHAECWEAVSMLSDDFSRSSFANFLAEWHIRVPVRCRGFIKSVAREFGLEMGA